MIMLYAACTSPTQTPKIVVWVFFFVDDGIRARLPLTRLLSRISESLFLILMCLLFNLSVLLQLLLFSICSISYAFLFYFAREFIVFFHSLHFQIEWKAQRWAPIQTPGLLYRPQTSHLLNAITLFSLCVSTSSIFSFHQTNHRWDMGFHSMFRKNRTESRLKYI